MKKTIISQVKEAIDDMCGAEFDSRIFEGITNYSVALSALNKRGYIEYLRRTDFEQEGVSRCIYRATGKELPANKTTAPITIEYPLLGGKRISDYPKEAVTVHRLF